MRVSTNDVFCDERKWFNTNKQTVCVMATDMGFLRLSDCYRREASTRIDEDKPDQRVTMKTTLDMAWHGMAGQYDGLTTLLNYVVLIAFDLQIELL